MPVTYNKIVLEETEAELMRMTRQEATLNLNDKRIKFCEVYSRTNNVILAAKKAGYSKDSAHCIGWRIRQNEDCNRYLAWLKVRIASHSHITAVDIIDQYVRIAFADITDVCKVKDGKVTIADTDDIDGQIVRQIKKGRDGITVEMHDKFQALGKLERYFNTLPKDWHEAIEERKVVILEQRLELDKQRAGAGFDDDEDDGFLTAIKESASEVWDD